MKPLFYSMFSNKEFIFSSEIKPILYYKDYKKINPKNMMLPLMMGLGAPGKTIFENINEVKAGELIPLLRAKLATNISAAPLGFMIVSFL